MPSKGAAHRLPIAPAEVRRRLPENANVDRWRLRHGTNASIRDGDQLSRSYFVTNRGAESMGSNTWSHLEITALGRQVGWEDSPAGCPQTEPSQW